MHHAGMRAQDSEILKGTGQFTFQESGFRYALASSPQTVTFSVSNDNNSVSLVTWAFGAGEYGQTYILEKNDSYTEARLSYFTSLHALNITPGQSAKAPQDAEEALGKKLDRETARLCFGCHTTGAVTSRIFESEKATPGVTCEACHGPGAAHVAAMKKQDYKSSSAAMMNPAHLSPSDSVDFCGACHRTWADVEMGMPTNMGAARVRFQPYRLEMSRCWGIGDDPRITCIACHDPHQPLAHPSAAYDAKCLACHSGRQDAKTHIALKTCRVGKKNCAACHMAKVEVPEAHAVFTDHDIRVVPLR